MSRRRADVPVTLAPDAAPRVFVETSRTGRSFELSDEDRAHALRVLRLRVGDAALGLDGRGTLQPLRVAEVGRDHVRLEAAGEPHVEPPPGAPGAALPRIEVAVSFPRGARADEMVERLVQLGAAAITPLIAERTPPHAARGAHRPERLERIARESCKQCRRSWLPEIREPIDVAACSRLPGHLCLLSPTADRTLLRWIRDLPPSSGTPSQPLLLLIGPEGGFTAPEQALLSSRATPACIAPHILRIETAAEAAVALAVNAWLERASRPRTPTPAE